MGDPMTTEAVVEKYCQPIMSYGYGALIAATQAHRLCTFCGQRVWFDCEVPAEYRCPYCNKRQLGTNA